MSFFIKDILGDEINDSTQPRDAAEQRYEKESKEAKKNKIGKFSRNLLLIDISKINSQLN